MFIHGELYERAFETRAGVVELLAEVVIDGSTLELRDLAVYPTASQRLHVSPAELLGAARQALQDAREQGFEVVKITATRLTGARPGRRVTLEIRLTKEPDERYPPTGQPDDR